MKYQSGNYIKKEEVQPPVVGIIDDVREETLKSDTGDETKPVMHFRDGKPRALVMNKTNWDVCTEAFGSDESDDWRGRSIELYFDPGVRFGGKAVGGIRLRVPAEHRSANPPPPQNNTQQSGNWTLAMAIQACEIAGIDKKALGAMLRENGHTTWEAATCTPLAKSLITGRQRMADDLNALAGEQPPTGDAIPF